jgi:phenylacetate-coenzyme A ligase PaaK-like adenylate-forming protein
MRWGGRFSYAGGLGAAFVERRRALRGGEPLGAYQLARAGRIAAEARERSPFYRELYRGVRLPLRTLEDLPLTNKALVMANFDRLFADPWVRRDALDEYFAQPFRYDRRFLGKYLAFHTSGSSGRPGYIVWGEREFGRSVGLILAGQMDRSRRERGAATVRLGERSVYVGVTDDYVGGNSWAHALGRFSQLRILSLFDPVEKLVAVLNDYQPGLLASKPHVVGALAREQLAGRLRLTKLKRVTVAGENLTPGLAELIEGAFGVAPSNSYSACETGPIARQTGRARELDVFSTAVVVEILDDAGRPVREYGRPGRVVVTNLYNRTMPVLRYELGDVACFVPGPVPFGRLGFIEGRATSTLEFRDGGAVHGVAEYPLWSVHVKGLAQYQIAQTGGMALEIRLEWQPGHEDRAGARREFARRLDEIMGHQPWWPRVGVTYREVDQIAPNPWGKTPIVVREAGGGDRAAAAV